MRKLLKMKADEEMLRDEGDGLDFLLGFEEDAAEAARAAGVTLPSGPARPDGDESESDLDTEVLGPVDELPSEDDDEALGGLSSEGEDAMSEDEPGFGEIEVDADSDIGGLAGDFDGEMDGEFGSEGESEGGSESEEGSDEDEGDEEAANVEPAMYISRAEAYVVPPCPMTTSTFLFRIIVVHFAHPTRACAAATETRLRGRLTRPRPLPLLGSTFLQANGRPSEGSRGQGK